MNEYNNDCKLCLSLHQFQNYFLNHEYYDYMFKSDGSLNPNYNSFKKSGLISQILQDHWDKISKEDKDLILKFRPNADFEMKKVIDCFNKNLGCSVYECPNCHDFIFALHTCKSRFCTSCGYKYKLIRVDNIMNTVYNCKHRQIVFTIPEELRIYFFDFKLMNVLFDAVKLTLYSILNDNFKSNKKTKRKKKYTGKTKWTPGFFAFLHTFGRDIKWNPHIHVLIAELKLSNDDKNFCKNWNYFNYDALSHRFQKILLDLMTERLGKDFYCVKNEQYKKHKNGYYVYAEPKKSKNLKDGVEYVARYCGRPAISENRIISYDGENVIFSYNDHKDESYHEVTVSAIDFIKRLLRHLLSQNFKSIRSYGFYRKKHKHHDKIKKMVSDEKKPFHKQLLTHALSVLRYFNRNPYYCPKCDVKMNFICEILEGG